MPEPLLALRDARSGYGEAVVGSAVRIPAYAAVTDPMRAGMHRMRDNPQLGRPEDFARSVLDLVAAEETPLRVPVGADAYAYLAAVEEANRAELAAARTLVLGAD